MKTAIDPEDLDQLKHGTVEQLQRILITVIFGGRVFHELVGRTMSDLARLPDLPDEAKAILNRLVGDWNRYETARLNQLRETFQPGKQSLELPSITMPQEPWHAPKITVETFEQLTPEETLQLFEHIESAWHGMTSCNNELIRRIFNAPGTRAEHMEILNEWSNVIGELQETSAAIAERMAATVN